MPITPEQQSEIVRTVSSLESLKLAYLFGSRAREQANQQSDWDIAILTETPNDSVTIWELAQQLASVLDSNVDLIDLSNASTVMRMQVVSDGVLLFGNEYDADVFAVQTYSMYGSLQSARQAIVQDFLEEVSNK